MGEMTYFAPRGDETDITLVCTACKCAYRAHRSSHKDRRHCIPCHKEFLAVQARAITAVNKAVRAGTMKRAKGQQCVDCGSPAQCLDHRDYTKPLDVQPVCWSCNGRRGGAKWKAAPDVPVVIEAPDCAAITLVAAA